MKSLSHTVIFNVGNLSVSINFKYGMASFHPVIINGFYAMKKIILTSLFIFLPVNFGIGLLLGVYQTDQPLKIIVSLIISTLFYIVPMYFLLKHKAK